ncbi:hypothetical protein ACFL0M_07310 [Thermodesulfobacteriota bacterium]
MHIYTKIYEFSAHVGAFEGYVYGKTNLKPNELTKWINNIITGHKSLTPEVTEIFQSSLDRTLGRAASSIAAFLGEDHELVQKLKSIIVDDSVKSPDDF